VLLVDTANVLHVTGVLPAHLAGPDVAELASLIAASRYRARHAVLVVDGAGPARSKRNNPSRHTRTPTAPAPAPRDRELAGLDVVYSGAGREADDVIEMLIAQDTAPRRLLVVSADRRIIRAARRRRARTLASAEFLAQLARDNQAARPSPKPLPGYAQQVPLNRYALAYWLRLFGYTDAPAAEPASGSRPPPGAVPDISRAAREGIAAPDTASRRPPPSRAGERLRIPPPPPAERTPAAPETPQSPPPPAAATGPTDPPAQPPAELPADLADLVEDSGLSIDPADLDMRRWLGERDQDGPTR